MNKPYFKKIDGQPEPLRIKIKRQVRFEEVDALGIVWHGRYPGYFEEAREALGEKYGIGYMTLYENGIIAPIKKMHIDYHHPLKLQDIFYTEGILHWSEAARINFEFIIKDAGGRLVTTGYTVQVILDQDQNLCMVHPPFFEQFRKRWKAGKLK